MAEEMALEEEIDRIIAERAPRILRDERVWEPEPFEDQRAFALVEPEDPEEIDVTSEEEDTNADEMEDEKED